MDFPSIKNSVAVSIAGTVLKLLICYFLFPAILLNLYVFSTGLLISPKLLVLVGENSNLHYAAALILVTLIPLWMLFLGLNTSKRLLFICFGFLLIHIFSLVFIDHIPCLTIGEHPVEFVMAPSMIALGLVILLNFMHFLIPNQYSKPYLSLLPVFMLLCFYYEILVPAFDISYVALIFTPSAISGTEAIDFIFFSLKTIPNTFIFYWAPFCLYLLARFWPSIVGLRCEAQKSD